MQSTSNQKILIDFDDLSAEGADYLSHHGIKGQSWGKRRYQYGDGSLTEEGRVHYGVGPARKFGKSIKDAVRKTVNPTNEELDEKIAKQNAKNEAKLARLEKKRELQEAKDAVANRKMELKLEKARAKEERQKNQEYIDKINGKKKDPDKMSDRELQDEFMRLQKERQIRDLDKELHQGKAAKFIDDYVKTGVGEGIKRGLSSGIDKRLGRVVGGDSKENALKTAENALKLDILKGDEETARKASQRLYELDNRGKNSNTKENMSDKLKSETDKLKYDVLTGDEKAAASATEKLQKLTKATAKPKNNNDEKNNNSSDDKKADKKKNNKDVNSNDNSTDTSTAGNPPKPKTYTYDEYVDKIWDEHYSGTRPFLESMRDKKFKDIGIR